MTPKYESDIAIAYAHLQRNYDHLTKEKVKLEALYIQLELDYAKLMKHVQAVDN